VPKIEAFDPKLVNKLLEFALLPALSEHLVVTEEHKMIFRDSSLL
jgi:hypothetical protein